MFFTGSDCKYFICIWMKFTFLQQKGRSDALMVPLVSCEDAVHGLNGVSISGSTEFCVKLKDDA